MRNTGTKRRINQMANNSDDGLREVNKNHRKAVSKGKE
jgi:hypothetical protein